MKQGNINLKEADRPMTHNSCQSKVFLPDLYLDQKGELMASCTSWTVEINGGGFVPAGAPTLKSVQVQRRRGEVRE
jgi:hypothetical protein